jgi:GMP synthase (glutamine-hydrolysing)
VFILIPKFPAGTWGHHQKVLHHGEIGPALHEPIFL